MRSLILVKYVLMLVCLWEVALANDDPFQYVVQDGQIKIWSSKGEWQHSLQGFLSDEQKVQKYVRKKENYKIEYNDQIVAYEKEYEESKKKYEASKKFSNRLCHITGTALGLVVSPLGGGVLTACGVGLLHGYLWRVFLESHSMEFPKKFLFDSLEYTLIKKLHEDIKAELCLSGYLTNNGCYPNDTTGDGSEAVMNFIKAILQSPQLLTFSMTMNG